MFDNLPKFVFFTGKGGVGKSTIACATAFAMARRPGAGPVTLLSTDPSPALASLLQRELGPTPVSLGPGVVAQTVDSAGEWEQWRESFQQEIRASRHSSGLDLAFDSQVLEHLLDVSPPGLDEIIAITKILPNCLAEPGAKVVMVLGHTSCGAVKGACDGAKMGNLTELLRKIQPAVDAVEGHHITTPDFCADAGQRGSQRRLAMVNVTNRTYVYVGLTTLKCFF